MKHKLVSRVAAFVLASVILLPAGINMVKADTPDSGLSGFSLPAVTGPYCINACPGTDSTQLNFSWITQASATTQIKFAPASGMSGNTFPSTATVVNAAQKKVVATQGINQDSSTKLGTDLSGIASVSNYNTGVYNGNKPAGLFTGEYQNKATLTGLSASTKYSYSVSDGTNWSQVYTISTTSTDSVSFAAFGDPQIGAFDNASGANKSNATGGHKNVTDDKTGWANMLGLVSQNKKLDFMLSLGDEVDDYSKLLSDPASTEGGQWNQYNYFFNPESTKNFLQSTPLVAFSGNHDHQMGEYYGSHYNQPNLSSLGATQYGNDGDYWFTAGPVLFMVLNSNDYGTADHDSFMTSAVSNNPNAKWRVAMWHHSAYSESASHSTSNTVEDPIMTIRKTWPAMMERHNVDVVLQGHDHYYTRTAQMLGGNVIDPTTGAVETLSKDSSKTISGSTNPNATFAANNYPNSVTNPKGVVYFTLDSGSGSKFYNYGTTSDHTFSATSWQGYVPTYSYISFSGTQFSINTYSTTDYTLANENLIDSYSITKTATSDGSVAPSTPATSATTVTSPKTGTDNSGLLYTLIGLLALASVLFGVSIVIVRKQKA